MKAALLAAQAETMVSYLVENHDVKESPIIVIWRNLVISCFPAKADEWSRDSEETRKHFKRHWSKLRFLLRQAGVEPVKINGNIKSKCQHLSLPTIDENRTDSFWRDCIPAASSPACGFVCFPENSYQDHPLLVGTSQRGSSESGNRIRNQLETIEKCQDKGILSNDVARDLIGDMRDRSHLIQPTIATRLGLPGPSEDRP